MYNLLKHSFHEVTDNVINFWQQYSFLIKYKIHTCLFVCFFPPLTAYFMPVCATQEHFMYRFSIPAVTNRSGYSTDEKERREGLVSKHYSGVRFSLCCALERPLIIDIMYIITAGFFFFFFVFCSATLCLQGGALPGTRQRPSKSVGGRIYIACIYFASNF